MVLELRIDRIVGRVNGLMSVPTSPRCSGLKVHVMHNVVHAYALLPTHYSLLTMACLDRDYLHGMLRLRFGLSYALIPDTLCCLSALQSSCSDREKSVTGTGIRIREVR